MNINVYRRKSSSVTYCWNAEALLMTISSSEMIEALEMNQRPSMLAAVLELAQCAGSIFHARRPASGAEVMLWFCHTSEPAATPTPFSSLVPSTHSVWGRSLRWVSVSGPAWSQLWTLWFSISCHTTLFSPLPYCLWHCTCNGIATDSKYALIIVLYPHDLRFTPECWSLAWTTSSVLSSLTAWRITAYFLVESGPRMVLAVAHDR